MALGPGERWRRRIPTRLGKEGIRGFSAWDDVAVNTAYHPTARVFTLFHEVGHLLRRDDAACLRFMRPGDAEAGIERWCERFSANLLMPREALAEVAGRYGVTPVAPVPDVRTARLISQRFHVSTRAGSLRLQELGLAPQGFYGRVESELAALAEAEAGVRPHPSAGSERWELEPPRSWSKPASDDVSADSISPTT